MGCVRAAVLTLFFAAPSAQAQQRLELDWQAPEGCPSEDAIVQEVTRLVGGTLPEGAPIRAEARASAAESGFTLELRTEVEGALGERTLNGERCEELAAAGALILALMIDPEAVARAEPTEISALVSQAPPPPLEVPRIASLLAQPRVEADLDVTPAIRDAVPEPPTETPEPPTPIGGMIGVGGLLDVGTLPAPTGGIVIQGGLGVPEIDARLRAVLLFPQTAAHTTPPPGSIHYSAELWAMTAGVVACYRPIDVFRELGVCAAVEAGAVFGRAAGISSPRFDAGFWLGAGLGLDLAWRPEPWLDLEIMAEALGQIVAPEFWVTIGEPFLVYAPVRITGRFGGAAHIHF